MDWSVAATPGTTIASATATNDNANTMKQKRGAFILFTYFFAFHLFSSIEFIVTVIEEAAIATAA